jgi:hypothetical protein
MTVFVLWWKKKIFCEFPQKTGGILGILSGLLFAGS